MDVLKGSTVGNWVHKNDALGSFVVSGRDVLEPILTSSIPNGHFEPMLSNIKNFNFKIYANGRRMHSAILLLCKPEEDVGLTDSRIANDDDLDHVIIIVHFGDIFGFLSSNN